jgi:MFS transporter, DHA2 family, methylenomycin A resistance protein
MGQKHPRWTLLASSFGLAMALVDVTVVNVAVSAIQAGLNTGVRGLSWVIDGYTLAFASLLLLAGGLGDRLGAKRIFVIGLGLFTIASALCGAAPGLATLVLARILQGVGAALFMPSSLAILRQAYPKAQDRARAIGVWSALTAVAAASGPLVGGLLVASFGWRSIFLVNLPLGVVAVAMAIHFVRPSPRAVAGKGLDLFAQMTATASLALFTWALIERPVRGWTSPIILSAIVLSLAGLRAFVLLERRSANPILPLRLFDNRTFSSTASAALLYAGAFFGSVLALSLYFQQFRGASPAVAGLQLTAITLSFGVTSVVTGQLAARYGTRAPILYGLAALSASASWLAVVPSHAPYPLLAPALVLMGVGAGLVAPSMNAAILASVPASLSGIGAGVLNASRQVGTALGVAIFASFFHGDGTATGVRLSMFSAAATYLGALALAARASKAAVTPAAGMAIREIVANH